MSKGRTRDMGEWWKEEDVEDLLEQDAEQLLPRKRFLTVLHDVLQNGSSFVSHREVRSIMEDVSEKLDLSFDDDEGEAAFHRLGRKTNVDESAS